MRIDHIALWTEHLEELRAFYVRYFGGVSGEKYVNPTKGFESYFVSFGDGSRLELMRRRDIGGGGLRPIGRVCATSPSAPRAVRMCSL